MKHEISHEQLMRYLDDEVGAEERSRIETHLQRCSECRRELAIFNAMKGDLAGLKFRQGPDDPSVWDRVNRRLTRPAGWALLIAGAFGLLVFGIYTYVTSPGEIWEKVSVGAVLIGLALLFVGVARDRYREWRTDPYREIER